MEQCNVIAIDLAKDIFQVCIMTTNGKIIFNKAMNRAKLKEWLAKKKLALVAMESCGGAHYWARFALSLGHKVMVIPPKQVKPFRTGQKTDANDAVAIAVASRAANIKPARILSIEQQGLQSIEKMRSLIDKQKLQLSNQVRGLLLEFGIVINKSIKSFKERIPEILEDAENDLSFPMRKVLLQMWELYSRLENDFDVINNELIQLTAQDSDCQKLMKLEGVGPITAVRLKIQLGNGEHFHSGRQVAACIGLTPKQHSSGGKVKLGSVGKGSYDKPLRSCIFLGARAVVSKLKNRPAKTEKERWLKALIERRGVNCASMALANKTARTAYALLKNNTDYKPVLIAA
ncbi:MAG: IS110 family transposase [Colwellia sp.]|uniref:IS110 family transposase n=1 Tax=Colwellia sp. TaxID=56799 RepID=UPI001E04E371|nr:IS110 family transposase [Colwellia sp.]NQY49485.1 IS110 family transposase [Colwellia sp.]